jgi:hypothetical protein
MREVFCKHSLSIGRLCSIVPDPLQTIEPAY